MIKNEMTEAEATEWVYSQDESGDINQAELEAAFTALYGRKPDQDDHNNGLWSLCCNMTPNCGTRPQTYYGFAKSNTSDQPAWFHTRAAAHRFAIACGWADAEIETSTDVDADDIMDTAETAWQK